MTSIFVTGGAGFIGSHAVDTLVAQGHDVVVYDNLSYGAYENMSDSLEKIRFVREDLRNFKELRRAMKDCTHVLHLAGLRSVPLSVVRPHDFIDVNVHGHLNLLEAAVKENVQRLVFSSSSSVYGPHNKPPFAEDMPTSPASPYSMTKEAAEHLNAFFFRHHKLDIVTLRYFNVFGPRQDPNSQYSGVISLFIKQMLQGKQPTIFGDGEQSRDFTYVANNVAANLAALTTPNIGGQTINVCNGEPFTLNQLVTELNTVLHTQIEPIYGPQRAGDLYLTHGDNTKAQRLLGYKSNVSFREGLEATVDWVQSTV